MKKVIPVSIGIPIKKNEVWLQVRKTKDQLFEKLEFPGGKVESSEDPRQALIREFKEETSVDIDEDKVILFDIFFFEYEHLKVELTTFLVQSEMKGADGEWRSIEELKESDQIPEANHQIIEKLADYLESCSQGDIQPFICNR